MTGIKSVRRLLNSCQIGRLVMALSVLSSIFNAISANQLHSDTIKPANSIPEDERLPVALARQGMWSKGGPEVTSSSRFKSYKIGAVLSSNTSNEYFERVSHRKDINNQIN